MALKKRRATNTRPITTEEIELLRQRVGAALLGDSDLAQRFDSLLSDWVAVQKAAADKDLRLSQIRRSLLLAMGILPSSEKQQSSGSRGPEPKKGKNPRTLEEKLAQDLDKARRRSTYYKNLVRRLVRRLKKARDRYRKQKNEGSVDLDKSSHEEYDPDSLANEPLTPEEEAQDKADSEDLERCMQLGGGSDPKFGSASAQMIARGISAAAVSERTILVDQKDIPNSAINVGSFTEDRRRYDCRMQVTAIDLSVEKRIVLVNGEKQVISADISDIGPAKMKVTWGFLAQVTVLATQYALPFNRLALMLSTQEKVFKSSEICRYFAYVAERFLPVYLHFFEQLANVSYLSGDDTDSRVLEIQRGHKLVDRKKDPPWKDYRTIEQASVEIEKLKNPPKTEDVEAPAEVAKAGEGKKPPKAPTLAMLTAEHMGFEAMRADRKGPIKDFKTTLLKGRGDESNPNSLIVFYRSHLGGLGNLLDAMLQSRSAKAPRLLHLQTDLSRVNLTLSAVVKNHMQIKLYGCLSHVRRPFKRYRDENPMFCDAVLGSLAQVFLNEQMLTLHGRNATNIVEVRKRHSLPCLDVIEDLCMMLKDLYPRSHPLGMGARYFLSHPNEIKAFIDNPMIAPSNDESEQMVRMESLVAANSYFRQSIEGRVQFDICRTIGQTAIAAGCQSSDYIEWYLRQDPRAIEKAPADYTPLAYRQMLEGEAGDKASVIPFPPSSHDPPLQN
jgi:hypothetical protein